MGKCYIFDTSNCCSITFIVFSIFIVYLSIESTLSVFHNTIILCLFPSLFTYLLHTKSGSYSSSRHILKLQDQSPGIKRSIYCEMVDNFPSQYLRNDVERISSVTKIDVILKDISLNWGKIIYCDSPRAYVGIMPNKYCSTS